ncbi:MAG: phospholipase D-like domain-containing protein [Elusimicrobiota bacterium]|nr:phospholipase D-like domain-containing protein [Elusimicrobiota bacterium]
MKVKRYILIATLIFSFSLQIVFALPAKDVKPIPNELYYPAVHELLKQAEKSIYVVMFEMFYYPKYPESLENQLVQDLIDAHKRGVNVEVILEQGAFGRITRRNKREGGFMLSEAGVQVYFDSRSKTTHNKLIIVDERYTIIGSANWSYHALEKNNEASVLIDSIPLAESFLEEFNRVKSECPAINKE